jgi:putative phosphoesterase
LTDLKYLDRKEIVCIGVLSDTHIPDRVGDLHPDIIPIFQEHKVDVIIHAGDITIPYVLEKLKEVAPVQAVMGNRDWWRLKKLPHSKNLTMKQVKILLTHGHGNLFSYIFDKFPHWILGYRFEHFAQKFTKLNLDFDIVIFGHSHYPEKRWVEGRLFFNPGSAYDPLRDHSGPSIGLIEIKGKGEIQTQIIKLKELRWKRGMWVE